MVVVVRTWRRGDLMALTPAERDVHRLVIEGSSNLEIARARQTSVRTVTNQLATICRKFGVFSRSELASCGGSQ